MRSASFGVPAARAADVDSIMRMKAQLATPENALRWTHADWLREGFGANAWFRAYAGFELIERCLHYVAASKGLALLAADAEG
jgi:hypothetical protein